MDEIGLHGKELGVNGPPEERREFYHGHLERSQ